MPPGAGSSTGASSRSCRFGTLPRFEHRLSSRSSPRADPPTASPRPHRHQPPTHRRPISRRTREGTTASGAREPPDPLPTGRRFARITGPAAARQPRVHAGGGPWTLRRRRSRDHRKRRRRRRCRHTCQHRAAPGGHAQGDHTGGSRRATASRQSARADASRTRRLRTVQRPLRQPRLLRAHLGDIHSVVRGGEIAADADVPRGTRVGGALHGGRVRERGDLVRVHAFGVREAEMPGERGDDGVAGDARNRGGGGVFGLYKGWTAVLCRNIPQSAIKFFVFEQLMRTVHRRAGAGAPRLRPFRLSRSGASRGPQPRCSQPRSTQSRRDCRRGG